MDQKNKNGDDALNFKLLIMRAILVFKGVFKSPNDGFLVKFVLDKKLNAIYIII